MRRAVLLVFLALLTFDVSGVAALCDAGACDEDCPTDAPGGQCPPNCHFCSCCSLAKMTAGATIALVAPPARTTSWLRALGGDSCPDPAEILHIPKLFLA
jgi:hypothetical protein